MPSYKVKLEICGSVYTVSTNDPAEYLQSLAERLDGDMRQMMEASSNSSVVSAAIITALGYLDEETKTRQAADNMRAQIQDYLEDASKAKLAAEEARREVERLRRELTSLEKQAKVQPKPSQTPEESPAAAEPEKTEPKAEEPAASQPTAPQNFFAGRAVPLPSAPGVQEEPEQIEGQLGLDEFDR